MSKEVSTLLLITVSMYEIYLEEQEKTENPSNFIKAVLKKTAILFSKEFWITTYLIEERLP